ncbi:UTP--glucose-1-phosphate uridylyltransferase [Brevibacillus humidisoli]|uniref:UTP--glucose-1-phosphate uridylyltransferase n=1 Tax=Brevibacillus humidisoli TaxID=2895522 RepID=UPI001E598A0C|nr:UTP--glucose-1-phosphate uridylyltransferase [Brevibacillus humidisoli]UFJ42466.1 UTP--glucose-1-phosphate uridylyltransferase [Brevibacillus humidisoli]
MAEKARNVRKAVIPAAGLGTRFLPATKTLPKEMLPIVDKPVIQYVVEEAVASGIEHIVIVTAPDKPSIQQHFDGKGQRSGLSQTSRGQKQLADLDQLAGRVTIDYAVQEQPKGLGHAVWCAGPFLDGEPFAVLLGDMVVAAETPCLRQLLERFAEVPLPLIGVSRVPYEDVQKYGILAGQRVAEQTYAVRRFVEKPEPGAAPSDLAIVGRYILPPETLPLLEQQAPGLHEEIQLTDAINQLAAQQEVQAYQIAGEPYDAGDKLGFVKANIAFALAGDSADDLLAYLTRMVERQVPPRWAGGDQ